MPFSTDLPDPPVPADCDLRGLDWMPWYGSNLAGSEFEATVNDAVFRAAVLLWWAAWQQVPASSVPDDDAVLTKLCGLGRDVRKFRKMREEILHGFEKCSDGRLYHRFLSPVAVTQWNRRQAFRQRTEAARAARHAASVTEPATEPVTELVTGSRVERREIPSPPTPEANASVVVAPLPNGDVRPPLRGSRLHQEIRLSEDWFEAAAHGRLRAGLPPIDLGFEFEKFKNYWLSKAGKDATKVSWKRTWVNWALNANPPRNGGGTPLANLFEGAWRVANEADERKRSRDHGPDRGPPHTLLGRE